ncbi:hypothetical protein [Nonomuraea zeae]|uniref:Uncharacterized protein n=1 Tax=Nonomuraea zeae TaxID=1642303 RepID=A0A5S4H5W7_9ACTN|nr:hypothetical protein [Nonomuraea zeae]TMR34260.1 hypothetical protein ETD85_17630 [Nonomuraea zeae]
MHPKANQTGICLIRAEAQANLVMITIHLTQDISQKSAERVITVAGVEEAVDTVRAFLTSFTESSQTETV